MATTSVKVWDLPIRLTHWLLVLCLLGCYGTAEWGWLDMQWHFYFGYAILVLCVFRLFWGFVGGEHARFANFIRGPKAILAYLNGQAPVSVGHNPIGALSTLLLLGLMLAQSISGLFNSDEIQWFGPLSERVSSSVAEWMADYHESAYLYLLIFIGIHIVAVLGYWLFKKDNLILPMLTGRKLISGQDAKTAPLWLALLCLALAGGAVWALLRFWPMPTLVG